MPLNAFPYPGGKTFHYKEITRYFPDHRRYVEPFGGSGAVLLNKPPSHIEIYNDLDRDVVQFFEVLRTRRDDLETWLQTVPYSRSLYEDWVSDFYEGHRPEDPVERAGRWLYLRYTQFNGSLDCRSGFKTGGNRNHARAFRRSVNGLDCIQSRMAEVTIECQPYDDVLDRYDHPDTLFYLDPPYYDTSRAHYRVGGDFNHDAFVDDLLGRDAYWICSYDDLPPGLADVAETVEEYVARYSMSYSDERPEHSERLVMNFDPAEEPDFSPAGQATFSDVFRADDS